jgi:hypothetical protein
VSAGHKGKGDATGSTHISENISKTLDCGGSRSTQTNIYLVSLYPLLLSYLQDNIALDKGKNI